MRNHFKIGAESEGSMYSEEDLASAVRAGVISEESARAFRQHVAAAKRLPAVDEEYVRLLSGFNDIFVVIATVLLLISVGWIGSAWQPWAGPLAITVAAWGLAEVFTLRRRMALPSIVLLVAFIGGVFATARAVLDHVAVASVLAAVAAWPHWVRFKVPITVAAGAAALVGCLVSVLIRFPEAERWATMVFLAAGVLVFLLAMRWDASDVRRETRRSDVAFWLHLLAAPLLVHPVVSMLGLFDGKAHMAQAFGVASLYVLLSLVSLAIDRRAMMVSALAYVLYSFTALLKQHGWVSLGFASTALVIGSALLMLSAYWQSSRTFVLQRCPAGLRKRLPPLQ